MQYTWQRTLSRATVFTNWINAGSIVTQSWNLLTVETTQTAMILRRAHIEKQEHLKHSGIFTQPKRSRSSTRAAQLSAAPYWGTRYLLQLGNPTSWSTNTQLGCTEHRGWGRRAGKDGREEGEGRKPVSLGTPTSSSTFSSDCGQSTQRKKTRLRKSAVAVSLPPHCKQSEKIPLSFLEVPTDNINANMYNVEFNNRKPNECKWQSAIRRNKRGTGSILFKDLGGLCINMQIGLMGQN